MKKVLPIVHFLAVWPLIITFLVLWASFFVYSPSEVTELQRIPRILQGDTDWSGSNIFAAYVAGHFLFGVLGCLILARIHISPENSLPFKRVLFGFLLAFIFADASLLQNFILLIANGSEEPTLHSLHSNYFVCDYVQVFTLFLITYLASAAWIIFICKKRLSTIAKYALSPLFLFVLVIAGSTGISPKAGKILNAYVIPDYSANSRSHSVLLQVHRLCTACTLGETTR